MAVSKRYFNILRGMCGLYVEPVTCRTIGSCRDTGKICSIKDCPIIIERAAKTKTAHKHQPTK